jgi:hypothetical protein
MPTLPRIGVCPISWTFELMGPESRCKAHHTVAIYDLDVPLVDRGDGRIEGRCEHGIGHTLVIPERTTKSAESTDVLFAHGCDGCCRVWWELVDA